MSEPVPVDSRVPRILHSVAAKMQAKADAELEDAKRRHRIACEVIDRTERAALRAEMLAALDEAERTSPLLQAQGRILDKVIAEQLRNSPPSPDRSSNPDA